MFKRLFTWKGRINRREFIITFILGIVLIHMFAYLANVEFYQHYPYGNLKFNVNLSFFYSFAILGVVFGVIPLLIFNLYAVVLSYVLYSVFERNHSISFTTSWAIYPAKFSYGA